MEVILTKDVPKLGSRYMLVKVKPGYFRNYLFPRGMAERVTEKNLKQFEKMRAKVESVMKKKIEQAGELKKAVEGVVVTIKKKLTSKGKLYGSIAEKDIASALSDKTHLEIDPQIIDLKEHIKASGEFQIPLVLAEGVHTTITLKVEAQEK